MDKNSPLQCTRYWKHDRTIHCGVHCLNGGLTKDDLQRMNTEGQEAKRDQLHATARNTPAVRKGFEQGGYELAKKRAPNFYRPSIHLTTEENVFVESSLRILDKGYAIPPQDKDRLDSLARKIQRASTAPWDSAVLPARDPNPPPVIQSVFGSHTQTLNFHTQQEIREYEKNIRNAHMLAYHTMRVNYGIWAGNQDKYVQSIDELTEWEGQARHRELEYQEWLRNGAANA